MATRGGSAPRAGDTWLRARQAGAAPVAVVLTGDEMGGRRLAEAALDGLAGRGGEVLHARDVDEAALQSRTRVGVCVVLLDFRSADARRLLRDLGRRPGAPVVAVTADDGEGAAEALRLGAVDYVVATRLGVELGPSLRRTLRPAGCGPPRGPSRLVRRESSYLAPDDGEALAGLLDAVRDEVEASGPWAGTDALRIAVALDEAMRHVGGGGPAALTVVLEPSASRLTARARRADAGDDSTPGPSAGEAAPPSPRGLLLMRSHMDDVQIRRGGSEVVLVKRRGPGGEAGPGSPLDATFHGFARRLLDSLPDASYFVGRDGFIAYWNEAAERMTGYSRDEILRGPTTSEVLAFADGAGGELGWEDYPAARCLREASSVNVHVSMRCRDDRRIWVEARALPVRDASGSLAGGLVVLRDATSKAAVQEALRQARLEAESDPLTGLANRRRMDRLLASRLEAEGRAGRPFSLILVDLDHFKAINDGWGHGVGDRALVSFGAMLKAHSRAQDLVARFGGEEFVVLLPDLPLEVAARIAERLRLATADAAPEELAGHRLTASFGVAQAVPGESASQLLRRADAALYRAKAWGRDRVEVAGPEEGGRR